MLISATLPFTRWEEILKDKDFSRDIFKYYLHAKRIQEIDAKYYQPYQDSCHKMVWQKYIYPVFGCGYRAFLRYLKVDTSGLPERRQDGSGIK